MRTPLLSSRRRLPIPRLFAVILSISLTFPQNILLAAEGGEKPADKPPQQEKKEDKTGQERNVSDKEEFPPEDTHPPGWEPGDPPDYNHARYLQLSRIQDHDEVFDRLLKLDPKKAGRYILDVALRQGKDPAGAARLRRFVERLGRDPSRWAGRDCPEAELFAQLDDVFLSIIKSDMKEDDPSRRLLTDELHDVAKELKVLRDQVKELRGAQDETVVHGVDMGSEGIRHAGRSRDARTPEIEQIDLDPANKASGAATELATVVGENGPRVDADKMARAFTGDRRHAALTDPKLQPAAGIMIPPKTVQEAIERTKAVPRVAALSTEIKPVPEAVPLEKEGTDAVPVLGILEKGFGRYRDVFQDFVSAAPQGMKGAAQEERPEELPAPAPLTEAQKKSLARMKGDDGMEYLLGLQALAKEKDPSAAALLKAIGLAAARRREGDVKTHWLQLQGTFWDGITALSKLDPKDLRAALRADPGAAHALVESLGRESSYEERKRIEKVLLAGGAEILPAVLAACEGKPFPGSAPGADGKAAPFFDPRSRGRLFDLLVRMEPVPEQAEGIFLKALESGAGIIKRPGGWGQESRPHPDAAIWGSASGALARMGPKAVPALTQALSSSDPDVRAGALRALSLIGEKHKVPTAKMVETARALLRHKVPELDITDSALQSHAARALSLMPREAAAQAAPELIQALESPGWGYREWNKGMLVEVMRALERAGPAAAGAVPRLISTAQHPPSGMAGDKARRAAVEALASVGVQDPAAMSYLTGLLDPSKEVPADLRLTAIDGLAASGRPAPERLRALTRLFLAAKSGPLREKGLRSRSRQALETLGKGTLLGEVMRLHGAMKGSDTREYARFLEDALQDYSSGRIPEFAVHLARGISSRDAAVRTAAAGLLERDEVPKDGAVVAELIRAVGGGDDRARELARRLFSKGLADRLGPEHVDELAKNLDSWEAAQVLAALKLFEEMGPKANAAVPRILDWLTTAAPTDNTAQEKEDHRLLLRAVQDILPKLGKPDAAAMPKLLTALNHRDPAVREVAESVLATMGGDALPALMEAAASGDRTQRGRVLDALAGLGADAGPAFVGLLKSEDRDLRVEAMKRLKKLAGGHPESLAGAVSVLTGMIEQGKDVKEAVQALGSMGPAAGDALPALMKLHLSPHGTQSSSMAGTAILAIDPTRGAEMALERLDGYRPEGRAFVYGFALASLDAGGKVELDAARLRASLGGAFDGEKVRAAALLARLHPDEAAPGIAVLREALGSRNDEDRKLAAVALGRAGDADPDTVERLTRMAYRDKDVLAQAAGAKALGLLGMKDPERFLPLLKGLMSGRHFSVKAEALDAAAALAPRSEGALALLISHVSGENRTLRGTALEHLEGMELDPDTARPHLVSWLLLPSAEDQEAAEVRARMMRLALAASKGRIEEPLLRGLESPRGEVRGVAQDVLRSLTVGRDVPKAVARLSSEVHDSRRDLESRSLALNVLAMLSRDRDESIPAIVAAADIRDTKDQARLFLVALGDRAVPAMAAELKSGDLFQAVPLWSSGDKGKDAVTAWLADDKVYLARRNSAIFHMDTEQLYLRDPERAKALLPVLEASLLKQDHPVQIARAATSLGRIGGPEADAFLLKALEHKNPKVRHSAALALTIGSPEYRRAIPVLIEAATQLQDRQLRRAAVDKLNELAGPEDLGPLLEKARENPRMLYGLAQQSSGFLREKAIEMLAADTRSPDPEVRRRSLYDLGALGSMPETITAEQRKAITETLLRSAGDKDPKIRAAAVDALDGRQLYTEAGIGRMIAALKDPDPEVRKRAYYGLRDSHRARGRVDLGRAVEALAKVLMDKSVADDRKYDLSVSLQSFGADGGPALPALRSLRDSLPKYSGLRRAADRTAAAIEGDVRKAAEEPPKGVPAAERSTAKLSQDLPRLLRDPEAFAAAAAELGRRGEDAKAAASFLYGLVHDGASRVKDPAARAKVLSAAMKALGDLSPGSFESIARSSFQDRLPGLPERPPGKAAAAAGSLLKAAWNSTPLGSFFPVRDPSWSEQQQAALSRLKDSGKIRWFKPSEYLDDRGAVRSGFAMQTADGGWKFEDESGFFVSISPDGTRVVGDAATGAFIRTDSEAEETYDPVTGEFERRERGKEFPDTWWTFKGYSLGVVGTFRGSSFRRPAGEMPVLRDGKVYFYRQDPDGSRSMTGWMEVDGAGTRRYELLPGGIGFVENEKNYVLHPRAITAIAEGRAELPAGIKGFEGLLRALPARFPELDKAFKGDVSMSGSDEVRSSVNGLNIYFDEKDRIWRMQLFTTRQTLRPGQDPMLGRWDRSVLYAETLDNGDTMAYRVRGRDIQAYRFDSGYGSMQVLIPDEDYLKKGMYRFRTKEKWELSWDSKWVKRTDTGRRSAESWWDGPSWVIGKVGDGFDIVFTPVRGVLYGGFGGVEWLVARGYMAAGDDDTGAVLLAESGNTFAQISPHSFRDDRYNLRTLHSIESGMNDSQREFMQNYYQMRRDKKLEKNMGAIAFLHRGKASDQELADAMASRFGLGNLGSTYWEWGDEAHEKGDYAAAYTSYGLSITAEVGKAYLETKGISLLTTPAKAFVAAGGRAGQAARAFQMTSTFQRRMSLLSRIEMAAFLTPPTLQTAESYARAAYAKGEGKEELAGIEFKAGTRSLANLVGVYAALHGLGKFEGMFQPKPGTAFVLRGPNADVSVQLEALGLKPSDLAGLSPKQVSEAVNQAFRTTVRDGRIHPDYHGNDPAMQKTMTERFQALNNAKMDLIRAAYGRQTAPAEQTVRTAPPGSRALAGPQEGPQPKTTGTEAGPPEVSPALQKAGEVYGRFNHRLGQLFYYATGGSFGIRPESFGKTSTVPGKGKAAKAANAALGDGVLFTEVRTLPFSQLLPKSWRPDHYLSIGAHKGSPAETLRGLRQMTSPETIEKLGIGKPGGPQGFQVITDQPTFVKVAQKHAAQGWEVTPYDPETAPLSTRISDLLQAPSTMLGNATGNRGKAPAGGGRKYIITWDYARVMAERSAGAGEPASGQPAAARAPPEVVRIVDRNILSRVEAPLRGGRTDPAAELVAKGSAITTDIVAESFASYPKDMELGRQIKSRGLADPAKVDAALKAARSRAGARGMDERMSELLDELGVPEPERAGLLSAVEKAAAESLEKSKSLHQRVDSGDIRILRSPIEDIETFTQQKLDLAGFLKGWGVGAENAKSGKDPYKDAHILASTMLLTRGKKGVFVTGDKRLYNTLETTLKPGRKFPEAFEKFKREHGIPADVELPALEYLKPGDMAAARRLAAAPEAETGPQGRGTETRGRTAEPAAPKGGPALSKRESAILERIGRLAAAKGGLELVDGGDILGELADAIRAGNVREGVFYRMTSRERAALWDQDQRWAGGDLYKFVSAKAADTAQYGGPGSALIRVKGKAAAYKAGATEGEHLLYEVHRVEVYDPKTRQWKSVHADRIDAARRGEILDRLRTGEDPYRLQRNDDGTTDFIKGDRKVTVDPKDPGAVKVDGERMDIEEFLETFPKPAQGRTPPAKRTKSFHEEYQEYSDAIARSYGTSEDAILGNGSFGSVWLGKMTPEAAARLEGTRRFAPGEKVAVKRPQLDNRPMMKHEADMMARVAAHDKDGLFVRGAYDPELQLIVTEYLDGYAPLNEWLEARPDGVPASAKASISSQLDKALKTLRSAGVVHGDLKLDNILAAPDGRIKIIDFGIAAPEEAAAKAAGTEPYVPALKGERRGSPAFSSENQRGNGPARFGDDAFTVGKVLERIQVAGAHDKPLTRSGGPLPGDSLAEAVAKPSGLINTALSWLGLRTPAVEKIASGDAGIVFRFQRPGEAPVAVKVGKVRPGDPYHPERFDRFADEPERMRQVHEAYSKDPVPGFKVMEPADADFSYTELAAIRAAAKKAGLPASTAREMVDNGLLVVSRAAQGETLKDFYARGGELTAADRQVIRDGLAKLNGQGYIADDFSTGNIMVRQAPDRTRTFTLIDTGGISSHTPGSEGFRDAMKTQQDFVGSALSSGSKRPGTQASPIPRKEPLQRSESGGDLSLPKTPAVKPLPEGPGAEIQGRAAGEVPPISGQGGGILGGLGAWLMPPVVEPQFSDGRPGYYHGTSFKRIVELIDGGGSFDPAATFVADKAGQPWSYARSSARKTGTPGMLLQFDRSALAGKLKLGHYQPTGLGIDQGGQAADLGTFYQATKPFTLADMTPASKKTVLDWMETQRAARPGDASWPALIEKAHRVMGVDGN